MKEYTLSEEFQYSVHVQPAQHLQRAYITGFNMYIYYILSCRNKLVF